MESFNINGPVVTLDSLADVPKPDSIETVPKVNDTIIEIISAKVQGPESRAFTKLGLTLKILQCPKPELVGSKFFHTGSFLNDTIFVNVDPDQKESDWWQSPERKSNLKALMVACGVPAMDPDNAALAFKGKTLLCNIVQVENQSLMEESGEWEINGTFCNAIRNLRPSA